MILLTPLVLFLLLFSIYLGLIQNVPEAFVAYFLLSITIISMISAFSSGWFNMIKKAIKNYKCTFEDETLRAKASFRLLKEFSIGIGENFLVFIWVLVIQFLLLLLVLFATKLIGLHFIGELTLTFDEIKIAMSSPAAIQSILGSLTTAELVKLNYWNLLLLTVMSTLSFLIMFYTPSVIYKSQNPLKAFWINLVFVFKHFWSNLGLFLSITVINLLVSIIINVTTFNPILYFIATLLYFYFIVYLVVLIFVYYEDKSKVKNHCDSGSDCIGQDQICN